MDSFEKFRKMCMEISRHKDDVDASIKKYLNDHSLLEDKEESLAFSRLINRYAKV